VNQSTLNAILNRIRAKGGLPQADPDLPRPEPNPEPLPEGKAEILPGAWIEWNSPLFGLCRGRVAMAEGDRILIEDHPVTGGYHGPAWIAKAWIIKQK